MSRYKKFRAGAGSESPLVHYAQMVAHLAKSGLPEAVLLVIANVEGDDVPDTALNLMYTIEKAILWAQEGEG